MTYKYMRIQGRENSYVTQYPKGVFSLCWNLIRDDVLEEQEKELFISIDEWFKENLPEIVVTPLEGTYLVWLDCSELGISGKELDQFIVEKAGLWLDGGAMFGPSGADFQRVNIACPRATLELALDKLKAAVDNLG